MTDAGVQFHGIPDSAHLKSWFPKGELLVLDDLMTEGGEEKEQQTNNDSFICMIIMIAVLQKLFLNNN